MEHIYEEPMNDAPAPHPAEPDTVGQLLHVLSTHLDRVRECDLCRLELLFHHESRRELREQVIAFWDWIDDIEREACGD